MPQRADGSGVDGDFGGSLGVMTSEARSVRRDRRRAGAVGALVSSARPRQWAKNVLVFGAPATGGVLLAASSLVPVLFAFASFCLTASGVYLVNDVLDIAADRSHPTKRSRPIAAGEIAPATALIVAATLLAGGMGLAVWGGGLPLLAVVGAYVALSFLYMLVLRDIALLDIAGVAGGFLLRAVAGGVAADVALSMWFLMVAGFGSLFLAAGKRYAEYVELGPERAKHRRSLGDYSESYLRYIRYSSSTIVMTAYGLWAFEGAAGGSLWSGLSIIPFVLGTLRYSLLLENGRGATPEDVVLTDVPLLAIGAAWVLLVAIGVYVA